jgi:hypothetical protein
MQACSNREIDLRTTAADQHGIFLLLVDEGVFSRRHTAFANPEGEGDISVDSRTKR